MLLRHEQHALHTSRRRSPTWQMGPEVIMILIKFHLWFLMIVVTFSISEPIVSDLNVTAVTAVTTVTTVTNRRRLQRNRRAARAIPRYPVPPNPAARPSSPRCASETAPLKPVL